MICILIPRGKKSFFISSLKEEPGTGFRAVDCQHNYCTGLRNASQLFEPTKLIVFVKVREHRDYVDQVKRFGGVINWRRFFAKTERSELEILPAPVDCLAIDIRSVELRIGRQALHVNQRAPTAAAEVENAIERSNLASDFLKRRLYVVGAGPTDSDELIRVR